LAIMCTVCPIIHCFNGDSASRGPARKPDPNLGKCLDSNNNKVDEAMLKNSKIRDGVSRGQEREDEEEEDERCQLDSISNSAESGRQQSPPQPYRRRKNFYQRWTTSSGTEATNIFFRPIFVFRERAHNGKEATVNRALDGNTYPSYKLVHSVFSKINYGGLKHNSLYLGLVLPSSG
jgi:hypothetical protein